MVSRKAAPPSTPAGRTSAPKGARPPAAARRPAPAPTKAAKGDAVKVTGASAKADKSEKTVAEKAGKRDKPVRDSFTMPAADFALIAALKKRALGAKRAAKKSELLRAGLHALARLDATALLAALDALAPVKVGRPKKA